MRNILGVVVATLLLTVAVAKAQSSVTVTLTPEGQAYATSQGSTPQPFADDVTTRINEAYSANNVNGFLRGFADAVSFSNRGLGVDYASLPNHAIIGVGATVSAVRDGVLSRELGRGHPVRVVNLAVAKCQGPQRCGGTMYRDRRQHQSFVKKSAVAALG